MNVCCCLFGDLLVVIDFSYINYFMMQNLQLKPERSGYCSGNRTVQSYAIDPAIQMRMRKHGSKDAPSGLEGIVARVKDGSFSPRGIKDELLLSDQTTLLDDCNTHVSSKIATSTNWLKIWDTAIDFGQRGTKAIQSLFKEMTRPVFGSIPCSLCDQLIPESTLYFDHYVNEHIQGQEMTKEDDPYITFPGPCTYHHTVFHYAHLTGAVFSFLFDSYPCGLFKHQGRQRQN